MKFGMDMETRFIIKQMANNNIVVENMLVFLCNQPNGLYYVRILGRKGLKDQMILTLWSKCCNNDLDKVIKTIQLFFFGGFSKEEIALNLSLERPLPFIMSSVFLGDGEFGPSNEKWDTYAATNLDEFRKCLEIRQIDESKNEKTK